MGLFFRKSFKIGPIRVNLSKGGVGLSTGIPGFRIGTGPRGNYVQVGRNGVYYRASLPSLGSSLPIKGQPVSSPPEPEADTEPLGSDVQAMPSSADAPLLAEWQAKRARFSLWPFVLCGCIFLLVCLVVWQVPNGAILVFGVLSACATAAVWWYDRIKKRIVVHYELDPQTEQAFLELHDAVLALGRSAAIWHIRSRGRASDPKYQGGAGILVSRTRFRVGSGMPSGVESNLKAAYIAMEDRWLYFFPERVIVLTPQAVAAVPYRDLSVVVRESTHVEAGGAPRDAVVAGYTWQYTNKDGGPDRRFKNNPQLPLCVFEEIWLSSPTGLNEVLQTSRKGLGEALNMAIENLNQMLEAANPGPEDRIEETAEPATPSRPPGGKNEQEEGHSAPSEQASGDDDDLHTALLEILGCMMVADGRASRSEKERIRDILTERQAPWSAEEMDQRIQLFIHRVKKNGYRQTVANAMGKIELFQRRNQSEILIESLDAVAAADGMVTEREHEFGDRLRKLVQG